MAFKIRPINIKSVWEVLQKLVLWAVAQYIPPFSDVHPISGRRCPALMRCSKRAELGLIEQNCFPI